MARKSINRHKTARKQSSYGVVIFQCVAMYLMCFFVSMRFGPILPVGMAALMTLLVTAKFTTVSRGLWRGLMLGLLAGLAVYGGFRYAIQIERTKIETSLRVHHLSGGTWRAALLTPASGIQAPFVAWAGRGAGQYREPVAAASSDEEAMDLSTLRQTPEALAAIDDARAMLDQYDRVLLLVTIPPPLVVCTGVGLVAAWRASTRKKAIDTLWQRDLQKQS